MSTKAERPAEEPEFLVSHTIFDGKIAGYDLWINRPDGKIMVSVVTGLFAEYVRTQNLTLPEHLRFPTNFLIEEPLPDPTAMRNRLEAMSDEQIKPLLAEPDQSP